MYRWLLPVLVAVVHAAPQDNSEITYVKIQPLNVDSSSTRTSDRESRIEKIPLTIRGGNLNIEEIPNPTTITQDESTALVEEVANPAVDTLNATYINKLNRISPEDDRATTVGQPERPENSRIPRSDITEAPETTEPATDKIEATERIELSTEHEDRKTQTPKYISKLSYFHKSSDLSRSRVNLVERSGKKRFRSRCRCEKIWNCPKLQITVPRCPNEYFLCCF